MEYFAMGLISASLLLFVLGVVAASRGLLKRYQVHGVGAMAWAGQGLGSVLLHAHTTAYLAAAFGAWDAYRWWKGGGDDDTKKRLRKAAAPFTPTRRTAPAAN